MLKSYLGPSYPFAQIFLVLLVFLTAARAIDTLIFAGHLDGAGQVGLVFVNGLRIDTLSLSALYVLPMIAYSSLATLFRSATGKFEWLFVYWAVLTILATIFFEVVTPWYLFEYGTRPERKFFEYLGDPREVALMLWGMYGFRLLGIVALLAGLAPLVYRRVTRCFAGRGQWSLAKLVLVLPLLTGLMLLGIRSSFDHRPANPSTVAFADDSIVNALPLNSLYSVLYAAYRLKDEREASAIYGDLPRAQIFRRVAREKARHGPGVDVAAAVAAAPAARKNLVIILEESLGARFVGGLGGAGLTPRLDALAGEGWWFERLYATGTRSVRGIEAVLTGFPPTPGRSVVKLPNAQSGFFTLASLLREFGYRARFYYGGNAHFDNMKGFLLGNGFHEVIEQDDFVDPGYVGSWGVSDGDVFERMHRDLSAHRGEPLLSVVLTTSNHTPFDFPVAPAGVADTALLKTRDNAIRYADRALGQFIDRARQSAYWDDTVFAIVADHDLRVADFVLDGSFDRRRRGPGYFPVEGFHIPGLIVGGGVRPRRIETVASQLDLPPTLLGLIGVDSDTPMIGTDLTRAPATATGRAIMQYNEHQAYLDGESLAILRPGRPALTGTYRDRRFEPAAGPALDELADTALAHALWANLMYREGGYR